MQRGQGRHGAREAREVGQRSAGGGTAASPVRQPDAGSGPSSSPSALHGQRVVVHRRVVQQLLQEAALAGQQATLLLVQPIRLGGALRDGCSGGGGRKGAGLVTSASCQPSAARAGLLKGAHAAGTGLLIEDGPQVYAEPQPARPPEPARSVPFPFRPAPLPPPLPAPAA